MLRISICLFAGGNLPEQCKASVGAFQSDLEAQLSAIIVDRLEVSLHRNKSVVGTKDLLTKFQKLVDDGVEFALPSTWTKDLLNDAIRMIQTNVDHKNLARIGRAEWDEAVKGVEFLPRIGS